MAKSPPTAAQVTSGRPTGGGNRRDPPRRFQRHVEHRTIVLPDLRVLFVPVPKAACSSVLWLLAAMAGIPPERFARSTLPSPSPGLTVHDMSIWDEELRFSQYEGEDRDRILTEDGWFRFSVVRDPRTRLWSAWASKLLLREPRFVRRFGEEPWFPRSPRVPQDLVEGFRRFVDAVGANGPHDVHWGVQTHLVDRLSLDHVGRIEQLDLTLERLRAHVGRERWPAETPHENPTGIPMPSFAFDEAAAETVNRIYRADFERFGYDHAEPSRKADQDDWNKRVSPLLSFIREVGVRNERITQLHRTLRDTLDQSAGNGATSRLANREGESDFDVEWGWAKGRLEPGFTAVMRVKNEARSLPFVLPQLLNAVRRVVFVDNGSTDASGELAKEIAADVGAGDRLDVFEYPFSVARCGPEHLETPPDSVHSLTYYYNWSFSHVRTRYVLKWDGDMVLTDALASILRDLAWQLEGELRVLQIPCPPLYVSDERHAYLDVTARNPEPRAWPNGPEYRFSKGIEWELWPMPQGIQKVLLPDLLSFEIKHLDVDEFANWSYRSFDATGRTKRKRREWEVFHALAEGREPPEGIVAIEAPVGESVVDFVRSRWLSTLSAETQQS